MAAVVASHLAVCPACAVQVSKLERIGEALFDRIEPVRLDRAAPVAAARALEAGDARSAGSHTAPGEIPWPLISIIGSELDAIAWKRLGPGLWHYPLKLSKDARGDLRLIKVAPGCKLPEHGHGGEEMTLILRGSYTDVTGHYSVGDVADLDPDIEHAPLTGAGEGCICLIASEKPARFKGLFARIMQPLAGL